MATATIQPLASYLPSSLLKDIRITLTDATSATVKVITGESTEILSLDLDAYDGVITLYDLRSVVEEYMLSHDLACKAFTIQVLLSGTTLATRSVTIIYCSHTVDDISVLRTHFLTTLHYKLTHRSLLEKLSFFCLTGDSLKEEWTIYTCLTANVNVVRVDTFVNYASQTASTNQVRQILVDYDSVVEYLEDNMSNWYTQPWKILAIVVTVGTRTFSFYYTDKVPALAFAFRNAFNVYEVCALSAVTTDVSEVERSSAVIGGKTEFYDQTETHSYEVESAPLPTNIAYWIRQMFCSHSVYLHQRNDDSYDYPVLITESKCEVSDDNTQLSTVKFTWQYEDGKCPLVPFSGIEQADDLDAFSNVYNNQFD